MAVKTPVKLSQLSYVIAYVSDTEKALPFYRDILGMEVKMAHPGWVELSTGSTTLALHGEGEDKGKRGVGQPVLVFQVENIDEAYKALQERGVKFTNKPKQVCEEGDKLGMSADFSDPDGNLLSIFGFVSK